MKTSRKFKELEKLVKKHFDNVKWDDKENRWSALTKPNPNDSWEKPISLSKFEKEADSKFYFYMSGTSWDDEGNVDIKVRENIFESNMKHIQAFESFKKGYGEKIKQSDFKEIEIGKTVQYGGGRHEVIDNDGFVLTLKGKDGKLTKVNLNQFNNKGAINEARSIEKIEKDRSKVVSDMAEIVVNWKAAKESGDKKAEAIFLQKLKDLTAKKKNLERELNNKITDKDKDLELIISEDYINENEEAEKSFFDFWKELYGENFIKEYPKMAKLIKMHPNADAKTLSIWWNDIYGEDFKKEYPAIWDKLIEKDKQ